MANYFQYLNVSEEEFYALLESNDFKCNAAGRAFMAERVKVLRPRPLKAISSYMFREAEKLGFSTVILPQACVRSVGRTEGIRLIGVRTVRDVVAAVSGRGY